ncbi:MAG: hypothetical protein ACRD9L_19400 [Bryobacteraceae bacterium]
MGAGMSIDTTVENPTFQERFALVVGGSALLAYGVMHRRPSSAGVVVATLGGIFLGIGTDWLRRDTPPSEKSAHAPRIADDKQIIQ